jgi:hypothetical protein
MVMGDREGCFKQGGGEEERRKEKEEKEERNNRIRRIGKYNQFAAFASHKIVNGPVAAIDDMLRFYKQNQPVTN